MRTALPLLAATLALAAASPIHAQTAYGSSQSYPSPADRPERPEAPERPEPGEAQDPTQDLVRQLNLRGDQQAAFRDYQAAFSAQGQDHDDGSDDIARLAAMTTPQRLDDSARQMDRDRADFERVASATRRFYAVLDPGQKRTFDRLTAPHDEGGEGDEGDHPPPPPPSRR